VAFVGFVDEGTRSHLSLERIGSCELVAALPQGHPLAKHRSVPLEALAHEEFVFISEHTYPAAARFVRTACERAGFRPRILQTAERGFTALGMVAGNCGIALLPEPLRELPHAGVVFRQLADPPRADLYMAWIERRPHGVRQAFVDFCRRAHQEAK
jgi:DNA-binding transcriptional LysR family regulator